jgi:hypothetical protein
MDLNKFSKLLALLKEARSIVNDLLWTPDSRTTAKEIYLLGLLAQVQSLAVALRADAIEHRLTAGVEAQPAPQSEKQYVRKLGFYRQVLTAADRANVLAFDRRRVKADRRRMHTYLARDRRSGIADRRTRTAASAAPQADYQEQGRG